VLVEDLDIEQVMVEVFPTTTVEGEAERLEIVGPETPQPQNKGKEAKAITRTIILPRPILYLFNIFPSLYIL
jgi:hypothetical protein